MHRFKNILFVNEPSSTSTNAQALALQLARSNDAQLTICDVSAELPRMAPDIEKSFHAMQEKQVMSHFENLDLQGLNIKTCMLSGIPFVEIVREVIRGKYDLVIKSVDVSTGIFSNLFGEKDMRLMRKCPCPVWIIKQSETTKFERIVAAVDPDPEIPGNASLNKLILNLATSLAEQQKSELHIVHTWYLQGEDILRSARSSLSNEEVDQIALETEKEHRGWLEGLLEDHNLTEKGYKIHLVEGDAGEMIPQLAKDTDANLVVMGTVARTGIAGFFIGNTAESILRNVDSSVLTVKPEGFESPVQL